MKGSDGHGLTLYLSEKIKLFFLIIAKIVDSQGRELAVKLKLVIFTKWHGVELTWYSPSGIRKEETWIQGGVLHHHPKLRLKKTISVPQKLRIVYDECLGSSKVHNRSKLLIAW